MPLKGNELRNLNDVIKDRHIDWGTGTNQVDAEDIPIKDLADYFTATTIEACLAELYSDLNAIGIWDLTAAEVNQLKNIDTTTVSIQQWSWLGTDDQGVATTDSPTFSNVLLSNNPIFDNHAVRKVYLDNITKSCNWQKSVLDIYDPTSGLPGSPSDGDRYISSATANNWSTNNIYEYSENINTNNDPFDTPSSYTFDTNEITVSGGNAKLTNKGIVASEHNIPYTTPSNYSFDSAKVEVDGEASLKLLTTTGQTFNEDFADDTDFTYDSDKAEFSGGLVRQVDKLPSNAMSVATYTTNVNLNYGLGTLTGTAYGGASVNGNRLDLAHSDNRYVDYNANLNADSQQTGAIRFIYTPNYSGSPPSQYYFINISKADTDNRNGISIWHDTNNRIYFRIYGFGGSQILTGNTVWIPTQGVSYEIELNWDITTGSTRLFIEGIGGTTYTQTGTRDSNIGLLRVGDHANAGSNSNGYIEDLIIFSTVQHTSNYTAGYTLDENRYEGSKVELPTMTYSGDGDISSFTNLIDTEAGSPKFVFNDLYYNSGWIASDGSYAQANTIAEILAQIGTLPVSDIVNIDVVFDDSNSTQSSVSDLTLTYSYQSYSTSDDIITPTSGLSSSINSWDGFTETSTKTGSDEIKYILSDDDGSTWKYYSGGWTTSDGTYNQSNTVSEINTQINSFPTTNGKILVRAFLHSDDGTSTPELDNILIDYTTAYNYDIGSYEIEMNYDFQPITVTAWNLVTETSLKPSGTDIKYQYSTDSGSVWNGSWLTEAQLESGIQSISPSGDGTDKLRFKYQLSTTDSGFTPTLYDVEVISYRTGSTSWIEIVPTEGFTTWVEDEDKFYVFNGTTWVTFSTGLVHNDLLDKQGGDTDEYYHLPQSEHDNLVDANAQLGSLHTDGSPTFDVLNTTTGINSVTNVELSQLETIGTTTVSAAQWGYLGELDQALKTTDSPTFDILTVTTGINSVLNVELSQLETIDSVTVSNTQWGYLGAMDQGVATTDDVTFNSIGVTTDLTVTGDLTVNGTTVATREDTPNDNGIAFWDTSTLKFETDSSLIYNGTTLTLGSGKNISSADENLTFTFGRSTLSSPVSDVAYFSHRDMASASNFAMRQNSAGETVLNAASGQTLYLQNNNSTISSISSTGLSMNTGKFIGIGATPTVELEIGTLGDGDSTKTIKMVSNNATYDAEIVTQASAVDAFHILVGGVNLIQASNQAYSQITYGSPSTLKHKFDSGVVEIDGTVGIGCTPIRELEVRTNTADNIAMVVSSSSMPVDGVVGLGFRGYVGGSNSIKSALFHKRKLSYAAGELHVCVNGVANSSNVDISDSIAYFDVEGINMASGKDIYLPDSTFTYFGTGNDSRIYHNGTNMYIDNNTGSSVISAPGNIYMEPAATATGNFSSAGLNLGSGKNIALSAGGYISDNWMDSAILISTGATEGWYKLGSLSGSASTVSVMVCGSNGYSSEVETGFSYAQFLTGNADDEFGGQFHTNTRDSGNNTSFEWVKTASQTIDCYVYLGTYFIGSVKIFNGNNFTINSTASTKLTDPTGTSLTEGWYIDSPIRPPDNDLKVYGSDPKITIYDEDAGGGAKLVVKSSHASVNDEYHIGVKGTDVFYIRNETDSIDLFNIDSSQNIDINGDIYMQASDGIYTIGHKNSDIGGASNAFNTVFADDFTNVASDTKYVDIDPKIALDEIIGLTKKIDNDQIDWGKSKISKPVKIKIFKAKNRMNGKLYDKREEVPMDYKIQTGETIEEHHLISDSVTKSYLFGAIKELNKKIDELNLEIKNLKN